MPKAFTERERCAIGGRLLEEGRKQFAAFGLRKTTVAELAEGAGISKGAFYHFYPSKEALLMDVVEQAERQFRQAVLSTVALPGPTAQARLAAILRRAFSVWKTIPVLHIFTRGDYELLARKVAPEQLRAHLASDRVFVEELIACCRESGIPVQVRAEELDGLLHAVFFTSLHEDDLGPGTLTAPLHLLLDLIAAYCLGQAVAPEPVTTEHGAPALPAGLSSEPSHAPSN